MLHDSPVIREIEATGTITPRWPTYECPDCGGRMSGDVEIYDFDGDLICGPCFLDRVRLMGAEELAERLDMTRHTAAEVIRLGKGHAPAYPG